MTIPVKADVSLWEQLQFLPVPAGTAILGLEDKVVERFINAYGEDWRIFFLREAPFHQVEVGAFELSRYPVTNGIYAQFMAEGGYDNPELWTPEGWAWRVQTKRAHPLHWGDPRFAGEDRPVVGVSWFEAIAVAHWASIKTGRKVRLPSEAEWEYAARADNLKSNYPWGGAWDPQKLNSGFNDEKYRSIGSTTPVGAFSPVGDAPFGHAEMLGQVWEWTNSLFRPYPFNALDGREDRYSPEGRIMRGGNWADGKYVNRVTTRYYYPPYYSDKTNGFRLAVDGDAPEIAERPPYDLVVYGRSTFCPDLVTLKRWLHQWNVPHRQVQIDLDESAAYRLDAWLGARTVPTLVVARRGEVEPFEPPAVIDLSKLRNQDRGSMLHEPDEVTLRAYLARFGFQV